MKGDRYTTFEAISLHTVFRYVPDQAQLGPRVKVATDLCSTVDWYETQGRNPSQEAVDIASLKRNSGVYYVEGVTRVRVTLSDATERRTT